MWKQIQDLKVSIEGELIPHDAINNTVPRLFNYNKKCVFRALMEMVVYQQNLGVI